MKLRFPIPPLAAGLIVCQAVSSYYVRQSNLELYRRTVSLADAGYLTVPSPELTPLLLEWKTALAGGVFYTASIGAALTLVALAIVLILSSPIRINRKHIGAALAVWIGLVVWSNRSGFNPFMSLLMILVPASVLAAARLWPPKDFWGGWKSKAASFVLPLLLLGVIWVSVAGPGSIIGVRDQLLWSTSAGRTAISAYYEYTLYAAEAFKSLSQITLKTLRPVDFGNDDLNRKITEILIEYDYLPIAGADRPDLEAEFKDGNVILKQGDRVSVTIPLDSFITQPREALKLFSTRADVHATFRRMIYISILFFSPVFLYLVIFLVLSRLLFFLKPARAGIATGAVCLAVGAAMLAPVVWSQTPADESDLAAMLASDSWQTRTAALRTIETYGKETTDYDYSRSLESPMAVERYWLAASLGFSRSPDAIRDLLKLAEDPQINVACLAYRSLGLYGHPLGRAFILKRIESISSWYLQRYAYLALKDLGWTQSASN